MGITGPPEDEEAVSLIWNPNPRIGTQNWFLLAPPPPPPHPMPPAGLNVAMTSGLLPSLLILCLREFPALQVSRAPGVLPQSPRSQATLEAQRNHDNQG